MEAGISGKKIIQNVYQSASTNGKEITRAIYKGGTRNKRGSKKNKRIKVEIKGKSVNIIGINTPGISSKLEYFDKLLHDIRP